MIFDLSSGPRGWRACFFQGGLARLTAGLLALAVLMPEAQAKRYSSGGSKSYSSGSRSSSSSSRSSGAKSGSYSSGRSSYSSGGSSSRPSSGSRSGYDSQAARARQQADSQRRYEGGKPPPIPAPGTTTTSSGNSGSGGSTYRSGSSVPPPIPSGRGYSSSGSSGGFPSHRRTFSTGAKAAMIGAAVLTPVVLAYASRPPVYFQDPYGSPFWYWLLDQPREVRADWLHHHQASVDPERRAEMLRADPELQAQVDALAAKKAPVEPGYIPAGLKNDDMFADPAADAEAQAAEAADATRGGSGTWFWFITFGGGAALVWLVFLKRWKPSGYAAVSG